MAYLRHLQHITITKLSAPWNFFAISQISYVKFNPDSFSQWLHVNFKKILPDLFFSSCQWIPVKENFQAVSSASSSGTWCTACDERLLKKFYLKFRNQKSQNILQIFSGSAVSHSCYDGLFQTVITAMALLLPCWYSQKDFSGVHPKNHGSVSWYLKT